MPTTRTLCPSRTGRMLSSLMAPPSGARGWVHRGGLPGPHLEQRLDPSQALASLVRWRAPRGDHPLHQLEGLAALLQAPRKQRRERGESAFLVERHQEELLPEGPLQLGEG